MICVNCFLRLQLDDIGEKSHYSQLATLSLGRFVWATGNFSTQTTEYIIAEIAGKVEIAKSKNVPY